MKIFLIFLLMIIAQSAFAAIENDEISDNKTQEFTIIIKDNKFIPSEINATKGRKFKLIIDNQDAVAEEFECPSLNKEKIVMGGKKITLIFNNIEAGIYEFFGDFHKKTAIGKIVVE